MFFHRLVHIFLPKHEQFPQEAQPKKNNSKKNPHINLCFAIFLQISYSYYEGDIYNTNEVHLCEQGA